MKATYATDAQLALEKDTCGVRAIIPRREGQGLSRYPVTCSYLQAAAQDRGQARQRGLGNP